MEFLVIGLIFLILLLLLVWRPFFKQKTHSVNGVGNVRDEMNVRLYHEHKKEIEKDYSEGGIDEESYQYLLNELNSTLLQDIEAAETKAKVTSQPNKPYSPLWPIGLSLFIIIFSVALYHKQGSYQRLTELPAGHGQQQTISQDNMLKQRENEAMAYIEKLKNHVEANPDDTEAWYKLGQTYVAVGAFDAAVTTFTQVIKIEGQHADLLGAIAQALYYKNGQKITPKVQGYIDKALALDVNDPSTNILLGMDRFMNSRYQQAIDYWQRVIDGNNQGVNVTALKDAVIEAKSRLDSSSVNASNSQSNNVAENKKQIVAVSGPQLKVRVSLSDDVAKQLSQGEDRVVFIYAIPANGQRMPLAAVKIKASDLPIDVVLNNSQAMSPANTLGSVDKAHVYAIVSKSGGVGIKSGDYKAEALSVDVNRTETLELIVNTQVE
ncbi:MAG: c-type cytochrome biogenesis protein CcmI [Colwellia sp.]